MPAQIKRLALLFGLFLAIFLVARYFLVPKSFGEYGHYRGLSLTENQEKQPRYAGQDICQECHDDVFGLKSANEHSTISCETCHGPGLVHTENQDSLPVKPSRREFCAKCHSLNAARSATNVAMINPDEHNTGQDCQTCHNPHSPWENMK
jgi:hypothetical protein